MGRSAAGCAMLHRATGGRERRGEGRPLPWPHLTTFFEPRRVESKWVGTGGGGEGGLGWEQQDGGTRGIAHATNRHGGSEWATGGRRHWRKNRLPPSGEP